jgi:hypothetical protein
VGSLLRHQPQREPNRLLSVAQAVVSEQSLG